MFGQGVKEMIHLLELIHGGPENIIHGAGDLYVTVFGGRTRKIGTLLGRGLTFDQAMEELQGVTLESIVIATRTARAVRKLAERGVVSLDDFPLLMHVDAIINEGAEVDIPLGKIHYDRRKIRITAYYNLLRVLKVNKYRQNPFMV